jgi:hypothetical protein
MRMQVTLVDAVAHVETCGVHIDRRGSRDHLTRSRQHLGYDGLGRYESIRIERLQFDYIPLP